MVSFLVLHRLVDQKDTPVINILLDHPSQMYPLLLVGEKVSYLNECGVYVCDFGIPDTPQSRDTEREFVHGSRHGRLPEAAGEADACPAAANGF